MQDFTENNERVRLRESANDDGRNNTHSREGDLASDKVGAPLLSDDPAPLSNALHIPTLLTDTPAKEEAGARPQNKLIGMLDDYTKAQRRDPATTAAENQGWQFDAYGRRRPAGEQTATGPVEGQVETNRATTPAAPPRDDSATFVGVPSNHPKTQHSEKLAKLDKVALFVGAIIVIGPLFAAMIGRLAF